MIVVYSLEYVNEVCLISGHAKKISYKVIIEAGMHSFLLRKPSFISLR
jgi:hypothetical protein